MENIIVFEKSKRAFWQSDTNQVKEVLIFLHSQEEERRRYINPEIPNTHKFNLEELIDIFDFLDEESPDHRSNLLTILNEAKLNVKNLKKPEFQIGPFNIEREALSQMYRLELNGELNYELATGEMKYGELSSAFQDAVRNFLNQRKVERNKSN